MTIPEINLRVEQEANARLGETIDRLIVILNINHHTLGLIPKWMRSGLLEHVDEEDQQKAAIALEKAAFDMIEVYQQMGWELNEDYVMRTLNQAIHPYLSIGKKQDFSHQYLSPAVHKTVRYFGEGCP